ncbi:hypothetical protein ACHAQH_007422 [Verticillium albo-atrum]
MRSPLGGRNYETYSEDPLVLGLLAAAYVRGCQADGKVGATPKHFVANDAENQRTTLSVEVDEQTLREIHLKPFQLVQKLAEPWAFMTSYNRVQGEYVADSSRLINGVLREEWGFKGLAISDWMGTYSVGPGIDAGVDIELPGPPRRMTFEAVSQLIRDGSLSEETIDKSAVRVLDLARRLGRFENPEEPPERAVEDADRDRLIKESAADGITLLKNEGGVLPIKEGASVALIGQHSWSVVLGGGGTPSTGDHIFSIISTGRARLYIDNKLVFERHQETKLRPESFYFFKRYLEQRLTYRLQQGHRYSIRLESWACDPAILNAAPLFGKMFQGSAVRFHEHINLQARKEEAASAARTSDYAVVCVGTTNEIESEGFDRDTLDLTPEQYDLVDAVSAANPRTVVVNFSGAPVSVNRFVYTVPATVQAWFPGQETGDSLAAVLTGAVNPSGKLPLSWPEKLEDGSSFSNFPAGEDGLLNYAEGLDVGYRWHDRASNPRALYPFGFGLSYTTFDVVSAAVEGSNTFRAVDDKIAISAEVVNTGIKNGKVVVQFYVASPEGVPGRQRPVKELQAFSKIEVKSGQSAQVTVHLDKYAVSVYDEAKGCWVAHKGEYRVLVGLSSVDILQTTSFSVVELFAWTGD